MRNIHKNGESSSEEDPIPDFDVDDISKWYKMCEQSDEIHIGKTKEYILHLSFNGNNILASSGSEGSLNLFQLGESRFTSYPSPNGLNDSKALACAVRFDPGNENIFFTTRADGYCYCYDLRTKSLVYSFNDDSNGKNKTFTCMDINHNSRLVCCGTDKIQADSFLLFFETRQRKLLGGYWESHDDDITDVKFHPNNPDALLSCSTDGLLNVYDLKQSTEDDALLESFNTESSASSLNWFRRDNFDFVACVTHTNDLQIYNVESQDKILEFKREEITKKMMRNSHIDCYLIGCHTEENLEDIFLLSTSNFNRGECLRSLVLKEDHLQPATDFTRNNQIVRCSHYDPGKKYLFTGGESGFIHFWQPTENILPSDVTSLKEKSVLSTKAHKKIKPY